MSFADRLKQTKKPKPKADEQKNPPSRSSDPIFEALEATRASLRQLEAAIIDYTAKE